MTEMEYKSPDGRLYRVMVPEHDTSHPEHGVRVGPPDLDALGLPFALMVELHNNLYHRGLFTAQDFNHRRMDALSAWQAALACDLERIHEVYARQEPDQKQIVQARSDERTIVTSEGARPIPQRRAGARISSRT